MIREDALQAARQLNSSGGAAGKQTGRARPVSLDSLDNKQKFFMIVASSVVGTATATAIPYNPSIVSRVEL